MESLFEILLYGGFFYLMMRFGCGSHMFGHGKDRNKKTQASEHGDIPLEDKRDRETPPRNDIDPVCGKSVHTDDAKTSFYGGMVYFFCTTECRVAFEAAPDRYTNRQAETGSPRIEHQPAEGGGHA